MNDAALQSRTQHIMVDELFPHAPEVIWKTLTQGALMARWLGMTPTAFEAAVGSRFTYQTTPAGAWDGTIQCEVLEAIPNRLFAYSWKGGDADNIGYGSLLDTIVSFTLEEADGGTRLKVVHSGFVLPRNQTAYTNMSGGWAKVLPRIGEVGGETTA